MKGCECDDPGGICIEYGKFTRIDKLREGNEPGNLLGSCLH